MLRLRVPGLLLLLAGIVLLSTPAKSEDIGSFEALRWDYRVLVGSTSEPEAVLAAFAGSAAELADRDLLYFLLSGEARYTNAPEPPSDGFWKDAERLVARDGCVLIGRDGGVKARYASLDLDAVFALIDTMPMRRQEMGARHPK